MTLINNLITKPLMGVFVIILQSDYPGNKGNAADNITKKAFLI